MILDFKSIRKNLIAVMLLISLVPLFLLMTFYYVQSKQLIKTEVFKKLSAIGELKVAQINDWVMDISNNTITLSQNKEFIPAIETIIKLKQSDIHNPKIQECYRILERSIKSYNSFNEIFVLHPQSGSVILSNDLANISRNYSEMPFFTKAKTTDSLVFSDIYYSKTLGYPTMTLSIPIKNYQTKTTIGILVCRINLNLTLYSYLIDHTALGKSGEMVLINKDHCALNELRSNTNKLINTSINSQAAELAISGESGIVETYDYKQVKVLAAYFHIPKMNWGLVLKQDLDELYAPIQKDLFRNIGIILLTSFFIYLITVLIANALTHPINKLILTTEEFKKGNYLSRSEIKIENEIGTLANTFNELADDIYKKLTLHQTISQITQALINPKNTTQFSQTICYELHLLTNADSVVFYKRKESSTNYELFYNIGVSTPLNIVFDNANEGILAMANHLKKPHYQILSDQESTITYKIAEGIYNPKEAIVIPICKNDESDAFIVLWSLYGFSKTAFEGILMTHVLFNQTYFNLVASTKVADLASTLEKANERLSLQTEKLRQQTDELQIKASELYVKNIELKKKNKKIKEANLLKSQFLSNMSHELRTPLNSIMALSRVLIIQASPNLGSEEINYLEVIERNGKHLLNLINDILDLSKIESGVIDLEINNVSPTSLINDIFENIKPLVERKNIDFKVSFSENLPEFIETDSQKLTQILINIIGNAIKFTDQGSINISVTPTNQSIKIIISDTGIGIAEKNLLSIFEEFKQADESNSRNFEGTGLGLSIARRFAEFIHTTITVESSIGIGSVFIIEHPIKQPNKDSKHENKTVSAIKPKLNKTILVVDDEPKYTSQIAEALMEEGYDCIECHSGIEALKIASEEKLFAITLDLIMPEMDGFEVLLNLKDSSTTASIPAILISSSSDNAAAFALGALAYLIKPIEKESLINEITKISNNTIQTILIIDDDEIKQLEISRWLLADGFSVKIANNGMDGILILENEPIDLIILDLIMPGMSGFEVVDFIRYQSNKPNTPIIILTLKDLTAEEKKLLQEQVIGVITKTDDSIETIAQLKNLLSIKSISNKKTISDKPTKYHRTTNGTNLSDKKSILIIEDNQDNLLTLRAILKSTYHLIEAYDGLDGINQAIESLPDLILLDISLPRMDGMEVIKELKKDNLTQKIPTIALTAQAMKGDREKMLTAGFDEYLSKPIDPLKLIDLIRVFLIS